ncbi:unnamed protein product [Didymodactylos carnosus]|uniref:RING-type domain-containing protein n=1 Tax=Didymodactylos carnosus TaxID=1234261 RepID=A0A8S2DRS8_9BILA|nr:unnamed protein product [Didymodactylos carnosus]CAF3803288.1 unnamed protein product [Didymodactylos carnosus]
MASSKYFITTDRISQDDINKDIVLCSICHHLLWKPVTCKTCKNSFCYQCIHQRLNDLQTNNCPFGCEYEEQQCSSVILTLLSKLQIECSYKSYGCSAIVSYDLLEDHEQNCDYQQYHKQYYDVQQHLEEYEEVVLRCLECRTLYQRDDMKQQQHTKIQCLRQQMLSMQSIMEQSTKLRQATFSSILQKQQQQLNAIDENLNVQRDLFEQKLNSIVDKHQQQFNSVDENLKLQHDLFEQKLKSVVDKHRQQFNSVDENLKLQHDLFEQNLNSIVDKHQQQFNSVNETLNLQHDLFEQNLNSVVDKHQQQFNSVDENLKMQHDLFEQKLNAVVDKQQQQSQLAANKTDQKLNTIVYEQQQKLNAVADKQQRQLQEKTDKTDQKINTMIFKQQQQVKSIHETIDQKMKLQQDSTEQKLSANYVKQQQQIQEIESKVDETISGSVKNLKQQMADVIKRKLITFNDVANATTTYGRIPNGYHGLNWDNFWYLHESYANKNSGYPNAFRHGHYIAFNEGGRPMSMSSLPHATFNIFTFEANAAFYDSLQLTITGFRNQKEIYTKTVTLEYTKSQVYELNWWNIDKLQFKSFGGKLHRGCCDFKDFILSCLNLG